MNNNNIVEIVTGLYADYLITTVAKWKTSLHPVDSITKYNFQIMMIK